MLDRDIERELLPMAESLGLGVTAWSPLAGGILSGKYGKVRQVRPGTTPPSSTSAAGRGEVQAVADEIGATPSQVAIAWTAARSKAIVPIIGARSLAQLTDNLGAIDVTLTAEQVDRLTAATEFSRGFPHDFIDGIAPWVFGKALVERMSDMEQHPNVVAVREALEAAGAHTAQVVVLDDAVHTAVAAAEALGVEVGQIANSLIFDAEGEPLLVLTSGAHRVDTAKVAAGLGIGEAAPGHARNSSASTPARRSAGSRRSATPSRCARWSTSTSRGTT